MLHFPRGKWGGVRAEYPAPYFLERLVVGAGQCNHNFVPHRWLDHQIVFVVQGAWELGFGVRKESDVISCTARYQQRGRAGAVVLQQADVAGTIRLYTEVQVCADGQGMCGRKQAQLQSKIPWYA